MIFSISDSQILFTKGQFPCLYYMPACLSRLPCVSFVILSVVHPRATAWPSPPQGGARISTKILHFVQNDGPGRKSPQRVASFPAPMTPMQHRPLSFRAEGSTKMMKSFHEVSETESRNLPPLCCPLASPLPPSCRQVFTTIAVTREALIKSVSAFTLEILCNARNGMTRIASYLRNPMTKQCIKFLMKVDSMN